MNTKTKQPVRERETKQKAAAIQSYVNNDNHALQSMKLFQQEEMKLLKQQEESVPRKFGEEQQQKLNRLQMLDISYSLV